jgi:hypothetical protein
MAPPKIDPLAAKQAKQKKILIVLSIVLVAVLAIQVPKLMGGKKGTTIAAPTTQTPGAATPATPAPGAAGAPSPTPPPASAPTLGNGAQPEVGKAQLAAFTLFSAKDPFVQQIKVPVGNESAAAGGGGAGKGAAGKSDGQQGADGKGAKAVPTFATVSVNGEALPLEAKGLFPVDDPLFVLVSVSAKAVKIAIAGGKLASGRAITLRKGGKLTLVDTATGARYTLELLYTGTSPERTEVFTTTPAAGSTTSAAPGATTP